MALLDVQAITTPTVLPKISLGRIRPIRFRMRVIADNEATVPIRNASMYQGMIYDYLGMINPRIASALHADPSEKPWSFSEFHWQKMTPTDQKGMYHIVKDTRGTWTFNTIDGVLGQVLGESLKSAKMHFGSLEWHVISFEMEDHTYFTMPEEWSTITLHFHTPIFRKDMPVKDFDFRNFLGMQLHKFAHFKLLDAPNVDALLPYIHVIRDDTTKSIMNISKDRFIFGHSGDVTLKISGDDDVKETIFSVLYLSQFTGCGSRSSMGYGHMEIIKMR